MRRLSSHRRYPHTITFQEATTPTSDGFGDGDGEKEWNDVYTTEAHVQPLSSFEYTQAQQLDNPIDHKVFFPYTEEALDASMRFYHHDHDKYHSIRSQPLDQGGMGEIFLIQSRVE